MGVLPTCSVSHRKWSQAAQFRNLLTSHHHPHTRLSSTHWSRVPHLSAADILGQEVFAVEASWALQGAQQPPWLLSMMWQ